MKNKIIKKNGYSLVEAIIYVSILSVFFILIINSLLSFSRPYRQIVALRLIERSGLDSMERITREIRNAAYVDVSTSIFGTSPGTLTLVSTSGGATTVTKFYVQNNTLRMDINGVYQGPLSSASTTVTNLVFNQMSNPQSSAVKVDLTIEAAVNGSMESKKYHSSIILKGM